MVHWDGYRDKEDNLCYRSKESKNCDFYEIVSTIAGHSSHRTAVKPKEEHWSVMHSLFIFKSNRRYAQRPHKGLADTWYTGLVHCVNVGNRQCVFRHNGKVFVARNTDGLQYVCNTEVWCNRGFTDYQNLQCEGRLNRRGQPQKVVNRYILTAPDSGDVLDFSKLMKNRNELRRSL